MAAQNISDRASPNDIILLVGDYNLPYLKWDFEEDVNGYLPSNACSEQEISLTDSISSCGLVQVNSHVNSNNRLLDLAFTSSPDIIEVLQSPIPLLPVDAHHPPFIILVNVQSSTMHHQIDSTSDENNMDFRLCNYVSLNAAFSSTTWELLLHEQSVDANVLLFYDKVYEILRSNVPRRRRNSNGASRKPWWTAELRNLRNRLRKARKRFFAARSNENNELLRQIESTYNELLTSSYQQYIRRLESNFKQNPSMFWRFIKELRGGTRVPNNVTYGGSTARTADDAANLFSMYFQSVFCSTSPVPGPGCFHNLPSYDINLPLFRFSNAEVLAALEDLDATKGAGVDGLPPVLLKNCAETLVVPLTILFNSSIEQSCFPSLWKTASMIPVHKSGSLNNVENYRGISILCCLGKVLESLMHSVILDVARPIISEHQHGFLPHRSTTTNLLCYTNVLFREVELRNQVDAIYIDLSKAFDTVPHAYAVEKLKHIGFPVWIADWLRSYLTDRKAFVQLSSSRSSTFDIPSGVPQGSVLGPLIFVLFINDLCLRISSGKLFFADDLKIFRVIASILDCVELQTDIDAVLCWCKENGMSVNIAKCKTITFTRGLSALCHHYRIDNTELERVQSIRDLGVIMDSKLRFNEHISTVTAKAFAILGFIRRNAAQLTDVYALKSLFCALVRSILEYAAPVWAPYYTFQVIRIERIQKLFIRFALRNLPWNDPVNLPAYQDRCRLIDLELLFVRRLRLQQLLIFDVLTNNIDCPDLLQEITLNAPPRQLRHSALIAIPSHRTNYGSNNPLCSCLKAFNAVSENFDFNITRQCFKDGIHRVHKWRMLHHHLESLKAQDSSEAIAIVVKF